MNPDLTTLETVTVDVANGVGRLTLDRPDALNAFDETMQHEVRAVWRASCASAVPDSRAVI